MNKYAFLLIACLGLTLMGCADNKKETHKEISIEKKKSMTRLYVQRLLQNIPREMKLRKMFK